jgi:hypothetical protein
MKALWLVLLVAGIGACAHHAAGQATTAELHVAHDWQHEDGAVLDKAMSRHADRLAKGASRAAAIAQLSEAGYACLYGEAHEDYPEPAAVCARSFATRACQMDWEVVITSDPVLPDSIDSSGGEFRRDCVGMDRDWPEPIKSAIDNQLAPGPALPAASN